MTKRVTRLAPSPTGALHLGNARTFVLNYLLARREGWEIVMRMEDLDGPRTKAGAAAEAVEDLRWLGLDWDRRAIDQSQRSDAYRAALRHLLDTGSAYPCTCTRGDIQRAASAPHRTDRSLAYPGTCRGRWADADDARRQTNSAPAFRVRVEPEPIAYEDRFAGPQAYNLAETSGDFVVFKKDDTAGYQLAVVCDDADQGVTDVVRGDDLLESTARQLRLLDLLNLTPRPRYWHLPLVIGTDGRRLAKRHGDTRLSHYREQGVTVERVLGLIGYWSGLIDTRTPISLAELTDAFDIQRVPADEVIMTADDEAYLLAESKA